LEIIANEGGVINHSIRSMKWPGLAAVEISLVTITKQEWKGKIILNGKEVQKITPYLDDAESSDNPFVLKRNEDKSFQGSILLGMGFIMTPQEALQLISKNLSNTDVLFPYINGDDLYNNPDQSASRWAINFFDFPLKRLSLEEWIALDIDQQRELDEEGIFASPFYEGKVAADYPDCLERVEKLVRVDRIKLDESSLTNKKRKKYWWHYGSDAKTLYSAISDKNELICVTRTSKTLAFSFQKAKQIFADRIVCLNYNTPNQFALLQSNLHSSWAWKNGTALKTDLIYNSTDCLETFPFPTNVDEKVAQLLEHIGESYNIRRNQIMKYTKLGLTKMYNLFHSKMLNHILEEDEILEIKTFEKKYGKEASFLRRHLAKTTDVKNFNKAVDEIFDVCCFG
jgi:hypothetical protein